MGVWGAASRGAPALPAMGGLGGSLEGRHGFAGALRAMGVWGPYRGPQHNHTDIGGCGGDSPLAMTGRSVTRSTGAGAARRPRLLSHTM